MSPKHNRVSKLLFLGVAGSVTSVVWAATPPSTAITPGPEKSEVEVQTLYLNKDSVRPNRYTGPVKEGEELSVDVEIIQKNEKKDNRFTHLQVQGAGTNHPYLRARVGEQGNYSAQVEYRERPKYQYLDLQAPFAGNSLLLPQLQSGEQLADHTDSFDIMHKRAITRLSGQKVIDPRWRMNLVVNREDKTGNDLQGFGSWFNRTGFQMPSPINQRTDQIGVSLEYFTPKMQGRIGYNLSQFRQLDNNYFFVQDPNSLNINAPDTKMLSLAPENNFYQANASMAYSISNATKISTELDVARAEQDDEIVHDITFNDVLAALNGNSLNATLDTTRFGVRATHRLNQGIMLRANYRFDDRDSQRRQYNNLKSEFGKLRDTRSHDYTRHSADLDANVSLFGNSNLLVGAKVAKIDRNKELSDRSNTEEATAHFRLRSRWGSQLSTGIKGSYGQRTGSTYEDNITSNNEALRKYHLASVNRSQAVLNATWNALDSLALGVEVTWKEDDYTKSELGLTNDQRMATTITADYFPSNRLSGTLFATLESGTRKQAGITEQLKHDMSTYTFGLSGKGKVTADGRWNLGSDIIVMTSDIDIKASSGANYSTLKSNLKELSLYGDWLAKENLTLKLAYLVQDYKEADWALGYAITPNDNNTGNYWLMGAPVYDETVQIVVGSLAYRF